ncbi:MAG: hypothetical protein AAB734_00660 [Patescibacteria group bacterium]
MGKFFLTSGLVSAAIVAVAVPALSFADIEVPTITLVAERGGIVVTDEVFPEWPVIAGSQLSNTDHDWKIGFPIPWSNDVPASRAVVGIFKGALFEPAYPLVLGDSFSFVHATLMTSFATTTVIIPAPVFGDSDTPSGLYTLFVYELPETKFVCQDVEPFDCFEEPYTDQDFIDYQTTDTNQPGAPLTYPPLGGRIITFEYIAGAAPGTCSIDCFSSVVFIPGIKGSVLTSGSDTLWPPTLWSNDVPQLALNEAGESVNDIQVDGILDTFYTTPIYAPVSDFLDSLVTDETIRGWLPLAYDWRFMPEQVLDDGVKTNEGTVDILQQIEDLASQSKSGKVTLVAHSMGGLMGKAIIKRLQQEGKDDLIDSFVMVGSPQLGTPQAIAAILHGDGEGLLGGFIVHPAHARTLSQNMPSAYNLLPSPAYFNAVSDSVITFADVGFTQDWRALWGNFINTYSPFFEFMTGQGVARTNPPDSFLNIPEVVRTDLMAAADDFHATYDTYEIPAHIRVVQVAGWGRPTVKAVEYGTNHLLQSYKTAFTREGDSTVVYPSAISSDADETYFFNLDLFRDPNNKQAEHRDLLNTSPMEVLLESIVREGNVIETNILSSTKPQVTDVEDQLIVSTHSPVILGAYDALGNFTGIDPNQNLSAEILTILENIPGSSFLYTSESQNIFLPNEGTYTFVYQGVGSGPTTVTIDTFTADAVTPVAQFSDIPTTENTSATFEVTSAAPEETTIAVDVDGDSDTDETVQPDGHQSSLNELLVIIKGKILALNIKDKLKQNLLKKIDSLEKKIATKKQKNAKILANFKQKILNQALKGKIQMGDASEMTALLEILEAQAEDVALDANVLAPLKEKIVSLNIKASLKNDLLKRVSKLENQHILTNTLANLTKNILKKATNGTIADTDAQMLIDLISQIESAI